MTSLTRIPRTTLLIAISVVIVIAMLFANGIVLAEPESAAAQVLEKIADGLAVRQRGLSGMSLGLTPVRR